MHKTFSYDFMETIRNTNQWFGASAKAFASYPTIAATPNPMMNWLAAWGEVTERSFERMIAKPDWNIDSFTCEDGRDHLVDIDLKIERPFGDLIHFNVRGRKDADKKVLLIAPMSGHYATLLTSTVRSLIADCEVYITDWHNARDIPVSAGKFDIEDYTQYLIDFIKYLGPDIHVIAVCQPAPLALAATAFISEYEKSNIPKSLILIGGPIDPDANPTEVTDFGNRITMGQLEHTMIQNVGVKYAGVGRQVYPGLLQLTSFLSMNAGRHASAFMDQILRVTKGEASNHDKHNKFYDEYLAVMDMPAEFYLSTVERIFQNREIANNNFSINGKKINFSKITDVNVMTVEGGKDDISAPGQCYAALALCTGLKDNKKSSYVEPDAGHYGIFAGRYWRNNIRPLVLDNMEKI
jgi:poly(3-hydroxybutyrate) depolymerase